MIQKDLTKVEIEVYLDKLKKDISDTVLPVIDIFVTMFFENKIGYGMFEIPRMLFPEIDHLGALLSGDINGSAKLAIDYIKKYFKKVNPEYAGVAAFIYIVYRHGLMHTHTPKTIEGHGWEISLSSPSVKSRNLSSLSGKTVSLDGRQLFEDLIKSIDYYKEDISSGNQELMNNFNQAYNQIIEPLSEKFVLDKYKYITKQELENIIKKNENS